MVITVNLVVGGTERRAVALANGFAECGYDVTYLVTERVFPGTFYQFEPSVKLECLSDYPILNIDSKKSEASKRRLALKVRCVHNLFRVMKHTPFKRSKRILQNQFTVLRNDQYKKLRAFLLSHKDSVILSFNSSVNEYLYYAKKGCNCKILMSVINAIYESDVPAFQRRFVHKPDLCIFQTEEQKKQYVKYLQLEGPVIHNPVFADFGEPYEGERRKVIVNFCRMDSQKNLFLLVDAFDKIVKKYPDFRLYLYGVTVTPTHKSYKKQLLSHIQSIGLTGKITVFNAASDVHERIRDCAMFVSSSDYEGLSNSMIEAMALGMPCVCTDCDGGGARELIQNGVNGLLVPKNDVEELANAITRMIEDKELAAKCGKAASGVREQLSIKNIIKKYFEVIESL